MEREKKNGDRLPHPRAAANFLSIVTFSWTFDLFRKGSQRDLEVKDLYETLQEHRSESLGIELDRYWNEEQVKANSSKRKPSLLRALIRMFGLKMMLYGVMLAIIEIVLSVVQTILIGFVIAFFTPGSTMTLAEVYLSASGLCMCSVLRTVFFTGYDMGTTHCGMKMRVATCTLIYKKALRLSKTALGETTVGQVVNLLSNDVNRFDIAVIFLHYLWIGPLETLVITYFLWQEIGPSAVIGVAVLLGFIPLQGWLGKKTSTLRLKTAIRTDERVRLMNEIISGIQVIKMYTWEKPFAKLVEYARRKEINVIKGTSYIRGVMLSFIMFHTRISLFLSILCYVLLGNLITAQKVFVITSYFNMLRQTMTVFFPQGIGQVAEVLVSIKRLQKFLLYEENELHKKSIFTNGVAPAKKAGEDKYTKVDGEELNDIVAKVNGDSGEETENYSIFMKNAVAKWTPQITDNSLNDINLAIPKGGRLMAVIGPVGSGKSSLLQAILHELPLNSGTLKVSGSISYASQEPWLFAGSVRQNILFGAPMDKERYRNVVRVCALKTDFELFPHGDNTIVGERGSSLSGGQRARVNLARAVYKEADIYLLDDPLSAVDPHVGKHLFEDCITGYLKDKTVILVTHQLQYLNSVDHIILLQHGMIKAEGSYQDLQETGLDFAKLLTSHDSDEEDDETASEAGGGGSKRSSIRGSKRSLTSSSVNEKIGLHQRQISIQSVESSVDEAYMTGDQQDEVEEKATKGKIGFYVYRRYIGSGGHCAFITFMFGLCCLSQLFASASDIWITHWVNMEEHVYTNDTIPENARSWLYVDREMCIYLFGLITVLMVVFTIVRSYTFVIVCMNASMKLHNTMFEGITRATMYFFNTNPSGRILNRFSKDMGAIDELLPSTIIDCIQIGLTLIAIILVIGVINWWLMIPTVIIALVFYYLRRIYTTTSRSVKRLEGITRSPVFSHLNASLQGLTTIRAFGAQDILIREFDNHQDLHSSAWHLFIATSRAFGFWLDLVCVVYIALVTFSFLLISQYVYGGSVGLAITQAIGLTGMFQWGMRQSAELENQMTSVERVMEYGNAPSEPPLESPPDKKPPPSWPDKGEVTFKHFYLKYAPNGEYILKNLNFTIQPEDKVGIVGRTGAGKSSLIGALFRLAENEGVISIDGLDIHALGLHEVRSKISIIPQEPVLFSGTMRKNLDPFDEYADAALWSALEEVELKDVVSDMPGGLNSKMSEGGTNFSVGQRQLVCLARAIVRNNRILVLDEATANVDPQTDALIQTTIRQKFKHCTVLTIAHRLNTVMDSDKVLVMDAGSCVEFDHPYLLLKNKNGFLSKMVENTGRNTAEILMSVATQSYQKMMDEKIPHIDDNVTDTPFVTQKKDK